MLQNMLIISFLKDIVTDYKKLIHLSNIDIAQ